MPSGFCLLCERQSELQLSHVLPAFAYRWLRESSGNGYFRNSPLPNKRTQDGLKFYWLCAKCEELFSRNETAFAGHLFHPYIKASGQIFPYSSWLIHFCASVSWRVLRFYRDGGYLQSWETEALAKVDSAEVVWRDMLLGKRSNPGVFQQHMLPLDQVSQTRGEFAPNINRYLMRAIQIDICRGSKSIFTYAKLGRFIILGFIHEPQPTHWRGTKVHATQGYVEPRKFVVPAALADYLNEKARKMHDSFAGMSDGQAEKVETAFRENIDRFAGSDAFIAMQADIEMFGNEAFTKRKPNEA
jgi:hypothetical protein